MPRLALALLGLVSTSAFAATPVAVREGAPSAEDRLGHADAGSDAAPVTTTAAGTGRGGGGGGGSDPDPETVGGGRTDRDGGGKKGGGKKGDGKKGDGKKGDGRGDRDDADRERDGDRDGRRKNGFTIERLNPLHGTLVYGPIPSTHHKYKNAGDRKRPTVVPKRDLPERKVDRKGSLAAGLRAGTMVHGYDDGNSYSDLGLGLMARYRPFEAFGLEVGVQRHAATMLGLGAERGQTLLSGSGEVFLFPWSRMSPYALVGITRNGRAEVPGMAEATPLIGAHAGIGLELALGNSVAIDLEGRAIGWTNATDDETANPAALMATGGLTFHF